MVNASSSLPGPPGGVSRPEEGHVNPLTANEQRRLQSRRRFLKIVAGGSLGALGVAFAFPILGIKALTQYTDTVAKGDEIGNVGAGQPVDTKSFPVNSAAYVGPLGKPTQFNENQMLLTRTGQSGTADDFHAFSRICTHLGCSVAPDFNAEGHIHCPCHGSQFDPTTGKVVHGPAVRTLPHIPITVDDQGQLVVNGEYSGRIGAGA